MVRFVIAVLGVGLVLAGCTGEPLASQPTALEGSTTTASPSPTGQSPSGVTPTQPAQPRTPAPTGQPPASDPCTPAVLTGTVRADDSAAGNRYATLVVTNTGPVPCTLYGYGGVQLVAADGTALPTSTRRDEAPGPSLVRLAPGAMAAKKLHWGVVPTGDEPVDRPCQPEPRTVRVIPPDQKHPFTVDWPFGPVCAAGTFHDSAYYSM
jgi:Protein of unknown function (DUF4232)